MNKTLTITIDHQTFSFVDTSIKKCVMLASEFLVNHCGNTSMTNDIIKRWKKNQFFFRTNMISSELTIQ